MRRRMSRTLLVSAFLSATLALGAAPSYAEMDPSAIGVSDTDWGLVAEVSAYNNALMTFVNDQGEIILRFTGGTLPDDLQYPPEFTGFSDPNLTLWGEASQFATNDEVTAIADDAVTQLVAAGYDASAAYNPDTDQVNVTTLAPSSATDALVTTYGSKINIVAEAPQTEAYSGDTAHGKAHSAKKHKTKKQETKKHTAKKHKVKKQETKKRTAKKTPAPAPRKTKIVLTPPDPR